MNNPDLVLYQNNLLSASGYTLVFDIEHIFMQNYIIV